MKTQVDIGTLVANDVIPTRVSTKVCMYVLASALTDARILRDATALVEAGFDVTIVDFVSDHTQAVENEIHGIHMKHIIMPSLFVPTRLKPWFLMKLVAGNIRGAIRLLQIPANIYHVHVEKGLPACYIAARFHRKPFIVDTPELTLSDLRITLWPRLRLLAVHLITLLVSQCAGYITASPLYAVELRKLYKVPEMTVVLNVPPYQAVPKSDRLRQHLGLDPRVRIALYQGNLQPNRGLDVLVHAAPFLEQDVVIVMMGQGCQETLHQLCSLIALRGVDDRVKILPPVPYEELLEWTASADIGLTVLPPDYSMSIRRCLPNKFFEYLMAGLPVLSSQLDAIAEMIKKYDVGQVVPSLTPIGIAETINSMLADQDRLTRMRHNALEVARSEFYWEKESEKLVRLYHRILN